MENLDRSCIELAIASVLVNGSPSGDFPLKKGLRQGDPLSPLLFLLTAEGLGLLVQKTCESGLLQPAALGKDKVQIPLLQYADDIIFVCNKGIENILLIKRLLRLFDLVSGLKVKFAKCKIFGLNLEEAELSSYAASLVCEVERGHFKYLGLQIDINSYRKAAWDWLV